MSFDVCRIIIKRLVKYIWPFRRKIRIVFDASERFHYFHLEPIIKQVLKDEKFDVTIVHWGDICPSEILPKVHYKTFLEFWHDWFNHYDLLITTELERRPGWFVSGKAVCVFHGAGPKMSYIKNPAINNYDVVFSVGPSTYKVQTAYVDCSVTVEPIGLPITDSLVKGECHQIPDGITLDLEKKTLLYAPSWAKDINRVSMDESILTELTKIQNYNVVIRPHPNLLFPERCGGIDWNIKFNELAKAGVQISLSKDHSAYELLPHVDVFVGDISSVTYEFLFFDRPIFLYMKPGVLNAFDAEEFISPLLSATESLTSAEDLKEKLLTVEKTNIELSRSRTILLNETFFNIGSSVESAVNAIENLVKDR